MRWTILAPKTLARPIHPRASASATREQKAVERPRWSEVAKESADFKRRATRDRMTSVHKTPCSGVVGAAEDLETARKKWKKFCA